MNAPENGRYSRRFADPRTRPSNQRVDPVEEATRVSVEQLGRFIDDLEAERAGTAVQEAWRILHPATRQPRAGDPGE